MYLFQRKWSTVQLHYKCVLQKGVIQPPSKQNISVDDLSNPLILVWLTEASICQQLFWREDGIYKKKKSLESQTFVFVIQTLLQGFATARLNASEEIRSARKRLKCVLACNTQHNRWEHLATTCFCQIHNVHFLPSWFHWQHGQRAVSSHIAILKTLIIRRKLFLSFWGNI